MRPALAIPAAGPRPRPAADQVNNRTARAGGYRARGNEHRGDFILARLLAWTIRRDPGDLGEPGPCQRGRADVPVSPVPVPGAGAGPGDRLGPGGWQAAARRG